jgi:hypothetical protein
MQIADGLKILPAIKLPDRSVDTIIARHVPGITNAAGRRWFVSECNRVASGACTILLDLHADMSSDARGLKVQAELIEAFDWTVLDNRKLKCMLRQ